MRAVRKFADIWLFLLNCAADIKNMKATRKLFLKRVLTNKTFLKSAFQLKGLLLIVVVVVVVVNDNCGFYRKVLELV